MYIACLLCHSTHTARRCKYTLLATTLDIMHGAHSPAGSSGSEADVSGSSSDGGGSAVGAMLPQLVDQMHLGDTAASGGGGGGGKQISWIRCAAQSSDCESSYPMLNVMDIVWKVIVLKRKRPESNTPIHI